MADLIETGPAELEKYRPQFSYLLLEERAYAERDLVGMRNLVAALIRLENSREPSDVRRVVEALADWLQEPSQSELARAFVAWLGEILLPSRMPEVPLPRLSNFQEARTLLVERVKEWTRQWREEGLEEGLRKGREEGQAELLMRQIESKFGPLSDEVRQRIATADSDRRLLWAERVLTAERLEDIFE